MAKQHNRMVRAHSRTTSRSSHKTDTDMCQEGIEMSLDVDLMVTKPTSVYSANITHNLNKMADKAGLYQALWRPEELPITKAKDLIPILSEGLEKLKRKPGYFKKFNAKNGWGTYDGLVNFVEEYLQACRENPRARIEVSR